MPFAAQMIEVNGAKVALKRGGAGEPLLFLHGADGLGGADLPAIQLHGGHVSEKVMWETVRANPREVTIVALGPLTNLSRLLRRDPSIAEIIDRVIISGGTAHAGGNVTPVADLNFYCDPQAARHVVREPLTKTLVPLETTGQVVLGFDFLEQLPDDASRAGILLRRMLPHAFRAHRQLLGSEGICLHDVVTLVAATNPELFERAPVVADVEKKEELPSQEEVETSVRKHGWAVVTEYFPILAQSAGLTVVHRGGIFFKALANFQWDRLLQTDIVSPEYLEGCYQLGLIYPDLCSSVFIICERGAR